MLFNRIDKHLIQTGLKKNDHWIESMMISHQTRTID